MKINVHINLNDFTYEQLNHSFIVHYPNTTHAHTHMPDMDIVGVAYHLISAFCLKSVFAVSR